MGRWIKICGDEQPTKNEREERFLRRAEKVVVKLQLKQYSDRVTLTEKQQSALFSYGTTLQWFGRMRYLTSKETKMFDYYMQQRFLRMLDYKGPIEDFEKTTENDEVEQYVKSLPKRHMNANPVNT